MITDGKFADVRAARLLNLSADSIIVMDRGYNDYHLFSRWCDEGVWFVTRLKDNANYEVVENLVQSPSPNIRSDQLIRLTGQKAQTQCPQTLRRVVVWDVIWMVSFQSGSHAALESVYIQRVMGLDQCAFRSSAYRTSECSTSPIYFFWDSTLKLTLTWFL